MHICVLTVTCTVHLIGTGCYNCSEFDLTGYIFLKFHEKIHLKKNVWGVTFSPPYKNSSSNLLKSVYLITRRVEDICPSSTVHSPKYTPLLRDSAT